MAKKANTDADLEAIASAKDGDAVPVTTPPAQATDLADILSEGIGEHDTRIAALETKYAAVRQAVVDLAALLRNAGPPTKGALECVNNTLARLEPVANG